MKDKETKQLKLPKTPKSTKHTPEPKPVLTKKPISPKIPK